MRDALLISTIAGLVLYALVHPWVGIMAWTWISIMNPHRYSWAAADLPVAAAIAMATLLGILLTKDKRQFFITPETAVLISFMAWICITLPFSFDVEGSVEMWKRVMKIDFMILVALIVLHSRKQIIGLAAVLAGSIGFYGLKGGIFTVATGGAYRVWGPDGSFIEGNNEMALALVVAIPLLRFLQLQFSNRWAKHALTVVMILSALAAVGTQSRGALLAIVAMTFVLLLRSDRKVLIGALFAIVAIGLIAFMPGEWMVRMESIGTYEQDTSAMGRINAWWMAWNLACDRFFGGGFDLYTYSTFARYAPVADDVHAAHSIYFQVLGEHGFIGLFLFLLMWVLVWRSAGVLRKQGRQGPETRWVADLGSMCQVSLAGFGVGGAFLSLAYFDLPYNILVLVVLARRWMQLKGWEQEKLIGVLHNAPEHKSATVTSRGAVT
jgi:putative inorganic carbon (HCO3(-)) transporter